MDKTISIILRKPPHGGMYPAEGLRLGVACYHLEPTMIAMDDGVYTFLKNADKTVYQKHIDFLIECEIPLWVDKISLEKRRLTKNDLIDGVEIVETQTIQERILKSFTCLLF